MTQQLQLGKKPKPLTLAEIAERIKAHLKRFEGDAVINAAKPPIIPGAREGQRTYFMANAFRIGPCVGVTYVSYQGPTKLPRDKALAYLNWLDAGHVGRHYDLERERRNTKKA